MVGTRDATGTVSSRTARWVIAGLLVLGGVVFVLQNREPVTLRLIAVDVSAPLWIAFVATMLLGAVIGWLVFGRDRRV